ncbi:MAG: tetratricopeptide repeat protein [Eubacteriales bacterium]|nr:tetratricopeptide repeat protein [Eubacteriales bacterium]
MRVFRNILITVLCIAAVGASAVFGYCRIRGAREKELLEAGLSLMDRGNYREAREKFVEAQALENRITRRMSEDSLEEDLFKYAAICDFHLGDLDEAAEIYDRMLRIHPSDPSLMESRAVVYAAQGQVEEAVALFDEAIVIDRRNYTRVYHAALTLREYAGPEAGNKYLEILVEQYGDEADPVTRGQALCFLERYEEAVQLLGEIQNPDMQTSFLYASAVEHTGGHEKALSILAEYEEQLPSNPDMLALKGTALCGLARYEEAIECFDRALPLAGEGTELRRSILFNRIAAYENLCRYDRAKELAAEYAQEYPDDPRMQRENLFLQTR